MITARPHPDNPDQTINSYWSRDGESGSYSKTESTVSDNDELLGRTVTRYEYDSRGRPLGAVSEMYDGQGRLLRTESLRPDGQGGWVPAESASASGTEFQDALIHAFENPHRPSGSASVVADAGDGIWTDGGSPRPGLPVDSHDHTDPSSIDAINGLDSQSDAATQARHQQTIQSGLGALSSTLAFLQAIEQDNDVAATVAGVATINQLVATIGPNNLPEALGSYVGTLNGVGSTLGLISSILNLHDAFEAGDGQAIVGASANLGSAGIQAYAAAVTGAELVTKSGVVTTLGQTAGALGVVGGLIAMDNALEHGNALQVAGAAASTAASAMMMAGTVCPPLIIVGVVLSIIGGLVGTDQPMHEGEAHIEWDSDGHLQVATTLDKHGGGANATDWMQKLLNGLQAELAKATDAQGQPLRGLIPQRIPSLGFQFDPDGFNFNGTQGHLYLKWIDEQGQEQTRWYDGMGQRNDGSGQSLALDFAKLVEAAAVPAWEAQTVLEHWQFLTHEAGECAAQANDIQRRVGELQAQMEALIPQSNAEGEYDTFLADPQRQTQVASLQREIAWWQERSDYLQTTAASLCKTADRRALAHSLVHGGAQEASDGLSQSFEALGLQVAAEMAGDTKLRESWVDIDGDGYLERTEWMSANQGVLVIDANLDGRIGVHEFVTQGSGRFALGWLDANADGRLDASDPAFAALKLWLDVNGDGVAFVPVAGTTPGQTPAMASELLGMAEANIVAIEFGDQGAQVVYADGSRQSLSEQRLTGDVRGVAFEQTEGGLLQYDEGAPARRPRRPCCMPLTHAPTTARTNTCTAARTPRWRPATRGSSAPANAASNPRAAAARRAWPPATRVSAQVRPARCSPGRTDGSVAVRATWPPAPAMAAGAICRSAQATRACDRTQAPVRHRRPNNCAAPPWRRLSPDRSGSARGSARARPSPPWRWARARCSGPPWRAPPTAHLPAAPHSPPPRIRRQRRVRAERHRQRVRLEWQRQRARSRAPRDAVPRVRLLAAAWSVHRAALRRARGSLRGGREIAAGRSRLLCNGRLLPRRPPGPGRPLARHAREHQRADP